MPDAEGPGWEPAPATPADGHVGREPRPARDVASALPAAPWLTAVVDRVGVVRSIVTVLVGVALLGVAAGWLVGHRQTAAAGSPAPTMQQLPDLGAGTAGTGGTGASTASAAAGAAVPSAGAPAVGSIVVDVAGPVKHPGLVTLPTGARVADAIAAAGGLRGRRPPPGLDLAARVADGQLLQIATGSTSAAVAPAGGTSPGDPSEPGSGGVGAAPLNLNTATEAQLEALPGIGPVLAQRILDYVATNGGFTSVQQLQQVPGIGPSHFAEVESLVTT